MIALQLELKNDKIYNQTPSKLIWMNSEEWIFLVSTMYAVIPLLDKRFCKEKLLS